MNRKSVFLTALVAGLLPVATFAQVSPTPPQAAPAAQPAPPAPQAFPAKIALINFEEAVIATNEGQRAVADVQAKYKPQKDKIDTLGNEVESLKKQADAGKATMSADEYASRLKTIDTKEKQLQRDADDATTAYQADVQEAYSKVAPKVDAVMKKYVADNGYTILLNVGTQEPIVMWIAESPSPDITYAVIQAYNASTPNVTSPPPSAPSAQRRPPASTTPHPTTTPKPAATTPSK